jgi:glucose-1-phosphate cytidylyltransferase
MNLSDTQVVLLAGGLGTRIKEETANRPKPMIEIGGMPILWHLMKNFSTFGISKFIICAGYKSEVIVDFFANYNLRRNDFTLNTSIKGGIEIHNSHAINENWDVTIVHTGGPEIGTGGRLLKSQPYIKGDNFICTYGDGLADVDINKLFESHVQSKKIGTVTVINPRNRYGVVEIKEDRSVKSFKEKPVTKDLVNGGFFMFNKEIFRYLDPTSPLENEPLRKLVSESQLNSYTHENFWQSMDTFREYEMLSDLWNQGRAPWFNWGN